MLMFAFGFVGTLVVLWTLNWLCWNRDTIQGLHDHIQNLEKLCNKKSQKIVELESQNRQLNMRLDVGFNLDNLQQSHSDWYHKNFPNACYEFQALKICEEAGELAAAVYRMLLTKCGPSDALEDAVADVIIATIGMATLSDIVVTDLLEQVWEEVSKREYLWSLGRSADNEDSHAIDILEATAERLKLDQKNFGTYVELQMACEAHENFDEFVDIRDIYEEE